MEVLQSPRRLLPFLLLALLPLTAAAGTLAAHEQKGLRPPTSPRRAGCSRRIIQAIRDKNREAYLSCYLESERLARTGPDGFQLGYEGLAATAGQGWPDHIDAERPAPDPGPPRGGLRHLPLPGALRQRTRTPASRSACSSRRPRAGRSR